MGIPAEKTSRPGEPITNAALGYIHENGSPIRNIPARPFLYPGISMVRVEIAKALRDAGRAALAGNKQSHLEALNRAGLIGRNAVVRKITDGPFTPLKPSTLSARRGRGRTGTSPLIDTGKLRASITWVVRDKK